MPVNCRLPPTSSPPPQKKKTFALAFADSLPVHHVFFYFDWVPANFQQKLTKIILYEEKSLREYSPTTQKNQQRPEPGQLDLGISLQRNVKLTCSSEAKELFAQMWQQQDLYSRSCNEWLTIHEKNIFSYKVKSK